MRLSGARFFLSAMVSMVVFAVSSSAIASAATLYLDASQETYGPGDTFVVDVRLDPNGECVNVVSADIGYPKDLLRASAVSQGESILTLWTELPMIDQKEGKVTFVGGVPGGYCGRIAGDPGYANIVGKIVFSVTPTASMGSRPAVSFLPSTKVLLADGRGTPADLLTRELSLTVASGTGTIVNEWLDQIRDDTTPPEEFAIDIHRDPAIAGGRYFVVFQTTDKQSGVSHYELMERDRARPNFIFDSRTPSVWRPAVSPFVLEDQSLNSDILVRAIDNAGQIREETLTPRGEAGTGRKELPMRTTIIILGVFVLFSVTGFYLKRSAVRGES